jgi:hypothetical protein
MRRIWVVLQLLIAGGVALLAVTGSFIYLVHFLSSLREHGLSLMHQEFVRVGDPRARAFVPAGYQKTLGLLILSVVSSFVLWRAHAWLAAASIGARASRRLAGVHKWTAIVTAAVFLILFLSVYVLFNTMDGDRGSLWVFAMFLIPSFILNPALFLTLAGVHAGSAFVGLHYAFGDNRAIA